MFRLLAVLLVVLALAACLPGHAGVKASPSPSPTPIRQGRLAQGGVAGTIVSAGQGTITVQDRNSGRDVRVIFDSSVPISSRAGGGSAADLRIGATVLVRGDTQTDGTVKASGITLATPGTSPPAGTPGG